MTSGILAGKAGMRSSGILGSIALLSIQAGEAGASALSLLAEKMSPGSLVELSTVGYGKSLISTGALDNVLNYGDGGVWDPIRGEARFAGGGHAEAPKFIIYREATNTWVNAAPASGQSSHGYKHNAIDPATGTSYYRTFYSTRIYRYTTAWAETASLPGSDNSYACCGALVYFPEMGALTFWGAGAVIALKGDAWVPVKSGLPMGEYHNTAEYNAHYKMVFGGGGNASRDLYAMDASGNTTLVSDVPVGFGTYSAILTVDPGSGEVILLGKDKSIWAYHPGLKTWRSVPIPGTGLFASGANPIVFTVPIPISSYGVIMLLKENAVYLYKHKAEGPIPGGIRERNGRIGMELKAGDRILRVVRGRLTGSPPGAGLLDFQGRFRKPVFGASGTKPPSGAVASGNYILQAP